MHVAVMSAAGDGSGLCTPVAHSCRDAEQRPQYHHHSHRCCFSCTAPFYTPFAMSSGWVSRQQGGFWARLGHGCGRGCRRTHLLGECWCWLDSVPTQCFLPGISIWRVRCTLTSVQGRAVLSSAALPLNWCRRQSCQWWSVLCHAPGPRLALLGASIR